MLASDAVFNVLFAFGRRSLILAAGAQRYVLPGLGPEKDCRERFRSFRFRFCASNCFLFFFTEGFS